MKMRMKPAELLKRTVTQDDYKQTVETYEKQSQPIDVFISLINGDTQIMNNVQSIQATHTGLTKDARASVGDRIRQNNHCYSIEYVNAVGRFIQLVLYDMG